ncbi:hypothetical protein Tcan_04125 [Toxocara canis]|uniref:Uncharacterized protein n=1 Tax=Toxocara canis TaxID=6265 RepID=A0A0B2VV94_TOXCA|nr:hypothetical protein Tcan_04125 [Toxocara canis]
MEWRMCIYGFRCIAQWTSFTRHLCSGACNVYRRMPVVTVRSFQSYGLPEVVRQIKTKRKRTNKRWKNDPILEEKFASILKKALHESVDDAVNEFDKMKQASSCTVPDWMAVKMSSVLAANDSWDGAKRILDAQYLTTGANARFGDRSNSLLNFLLSF